MKKRSCRRTSEEKRLHDEATKIRKMTDEQICRYMEELKTARTEKEEKAADENSVKVFLEIIKAPEVRGIGKVTIKKLEGVALEHGLI